MIRLVVTIRLQARLRFLETVGAQVHDLVILFEA
jgi:hypothetical protein